MNPYWLTTAEQVCRFAKQMDHIGLTAGTSGNISARVPNEAYAVITPSGMPYEGLQAEDMVVIDFEGRQVAGIHPASSETPLHALLYAMHSPVQAIVHTHSLFATAFSVLRKPIPFVSLEGLGVNAPNVEVAEYQLPGTPELAVSAVEAFRRHPGANAILLPNHGLVCIGQTLSEAFSLAVNVEREANIYAIACSIGTPVLLSASQLQQIKANYSGFPSKTL